MPKCTQHNVVIWVHAPPIHILIGGGGGGALISQTGGNMS